MYYVFLIDYREPEKYEELMQAETKKKWERWLKEDMDSLLHKKNCDLV